MSNLPFTIPAPRVTLKKYSEITGIPVRTVKEMVDTGRLAVYQEGFRHARYIDLVAEYHKLNSLAVKNGLGAE